MIDQREAKMTASILLGQLESPRKATNSGAAIYDQLKLVATVKHIRALLGELDDEGVASTSRFTAPARGSTADLRKRLLAAEDVLASKPLIRTPVPRATDVDDFLRPSVPSMPTIVAQVVTPPSPTPLEAVDDLAVPPAPGVEELLSLLPTTSAETVVLTPMAPLLPIPAPSTLRSRSTAATPTPPVDDTPVAKSSSLLDHHHDLQQSLITDLTSMSSQLKMNSLALSSALALDRAVVEKAQDALDGNLTRMKKEGGRLGSYEKKSRGTTCAVIGLVAVVAAAWVLIFLLIKVT